MIQKLISLIMSLFEPRFTPTTPVLTVTMPVEAPKAPEPTKATIENFCLAIQSREGYIPPCKKYPRGTSSYTHRNPGNIRGTDGNFLTFESYEIGFAYLEYYVKRVMANKHHAYPKNCSIKQFFEVYAPVSDNNDSLSYAQEVSRKLDVSIAFLVKDLV